MRQENRRRQAREQNGIRRARCRPTAARNPIPSLRELCECTKIVVRTARVELVQFGAVHRFSLSQDKGPGHHIGSLVIVSADSRVVAEEAIRNQMDKAGLSSEPLNVEVVELENGRVLHFDDGDY